MYKIVILGCIIIGGNVHANQDKIKDFCTNFGVFNSSNYSCEISKFSQDYVIREFTNACLENQGEISLGQNLSISCSSSDSSYLDAFTNPVDPDKPKVKLKPFSVPAQEEELDMSLMGETTSGSGGPGVASSSECSFDGKPAYNTCTTALATAKSCSATQDPKQTIECLERASAQCGSSDTSCKNLITRTSKSMVDGIKNDIKQIYEEAKVFANTKANNQCKKAKNQAGACCTTPTACFFDDPSAGRQADAAFMGGGQLIGAFQGIKGNMAKACNTLKNMTMLTATKNLTGVGMCSGKQDNCNDVCDSEIRTIQAKKEEADAYCSDILENSGGIFGGVRSSCRKAVGIYKDQITERKVAQNTCDGFDDQALAMGLQASTTGLAAIQMQKQCDQLSANQNRTASLPGGDGENFNGDCSTYANAQNPICVQCRANPNDAQCTGVNLGIGNDGSGIGDSYNANNPESNLFDDEGLSEDLLEETDVTATGNASILGGGGGGGSGGGLGGGGGGGAMGPEGGGGSGYQASLKTDIGRGEGRTGFSRRYGSVKTGGSGGYSSGRKGRARKRLDLKKFLPTALKRRRDRFPSSKNALIRRQIGDQSVDLFLRIHKRFRAICKQNRLYGCK